MSILDYQEKIINEMQAKSKGVKKNVGAGTSAFTKTISKPIETAKALTKPIRVLDKDGDIATITPSKLTEESMQYIKKNIGQDQINAGIKNEKILVKDKDGEPVTLTPHLFTNESIGFLKENLAPDVFKNVITTVTGGEVKAFDSLRKQKAAIGAMEAVGQPRRGVSVRGDTVATEGLDPLLKVSAAQQAGNMFQYALDIGQKVVEEAPVLGGWTAALPEKSPLNTRVRNVIEYLSGEEKGTIPGLFETFERTDERGLPQITTSLNVGMDIGNNRMIALGFLSGIVAPVIPGAGAMKTASKIKFIGKVSNAIDTYGDATKALNAGVDLRTVAAMRRIEKANLSKQRVADALSEIVKEMGKGGEFEKQVDEIFGSEAKVSDEVVDTVEGAKPNATAGPGTVEDVVTREAAEKQASLNVLREVDNVMADFHRLFPEESIKAFGEKSTRSGGVVEDVLGIEGRANISQATRKAVEEEIVEYITKSEKSVRVNKSNININGYRTKGVNQISQQRSSGTYISLDKPFSSGSKSEKILNVSVDIEPNKIFDPNGVIDGTDIDRAQWNLKNIKNHIERGMKGESFRTVKDAMKRQSELRQEVLKILGYEGEAGWIDDIGGNRELIVFDKNKMKYGDAIEDTTQFFHGGLSSKDTLKGLKWLGSKGPRAYDFIFETLIGKSWKAARQLLPKKYEIAREYGLFKSLKELRKQHIDLNKDASELIRFFVKGSELREESVKAAITAIRYDKRLLEDLIDPIITSIKSDESSLKAFEAVRGKMPVEQLNDYEKALYDKFVMLRERLTDKALAELILDPKKLRDNYVRYYYDTLKMPMVDEVGKKGSFTMDTGYTKKRLEVMTDAEAEAAGLQKGEYLTPKWVDEHLIKDIRAGFYGLKQMGYDVIVSKHMRHIFNDPKINEYIPVWKEFFGDVEMTPQTFRKYMSDNYRYDIIKKLGKLEGVDPKGAAALEKHMDGLNFLRAVEDNLKNNKMYIQIPDDARYGPMRGMIVRKSIYNDLKAISNAPDIGNAISRALDKYKVTWTYKQWKALKTVWNPATHARNIMWNNIATYMHADVNPIDFELWGDTAKQLLNKNSDLFRSMEATGIFKSGFAEDLTSYSSIIGKHLQGEKTIKGGSGWGASLKATLDKANLPKRLYSGEESFFKGLVFNSEIQKAGGWDAARAGMKNGDFKMIQDAADKANKYLFDYSDSSPFMQMFTNIPIIGSPFAKFYSNFVPMFAEELALRPHRALLIPAIGYGMTLAAYKQYGKETVKESKAALPDWLKAAVPISGTAGDPNSIVFWDWTKLLPYMDIVSSPFEEEFTKDIGGPGRYMLSSKNPFSPVNAPVIRSWVESSSNMDYSGNPIRTVPGPYGDKQMRDHILRSIFPSLYPETLFGVDMPGPGGYGALRMQRAKEGKMEPGTGLKRDIGQARLKTYGGIDLQRVNVGVSRAMKANEADKEWKEIMKAKNKLAYKRKTMTDREYEKAKEGIDREIEAYRKRRREERK